MTHYREDTAVYRWINTWLFSDATTAVRLSLDTRLGHTTRASCQSFSSWRRDLRCSHNPRVGVDDGLWTFTKLSEYQTPKSESDRELLLSQTVCARCLRVFGHPCCATTIRLCFWPALLDFLGNGGNPDIETCETDLHAVDSDLQLAVSTLLTSAHSSSSKRWSGWWRQGNCATTPCFKKKRCIFVSVRTLSNFHQL